MLRPVAPLARALTELTAGYHGLAVTGGSGEGVVVRGITHDSRAVRPGDLYAALPGAHVHGAAFVEQAVTAGAVAVLTDRAGAERVAAATTAGGGVPVLLAADPRASLGPIASRVYGAPSAALKVLGVTGTNGKTTVAYLLEAGLRAAGHTTGLVGTVQTRLAGAAIPSVRTTPEATDLQALLAVMVERGVTAAAMEVSSHAIALHRVGGIRFAGAAFTNLSQDHLDFHPSMEDYFAAKAALFTPERTGVSVIDTDTLWGCRLAAAVPDAITCGMDADAHWRAVDVAAGPTGTTFGALGPHGQDVRVRIALPGAFNVGNALVALALLVATGVPAQVAAAGLASLPGVPGRMERVDAGQPFLGLVDYAHTPDAVETLLRTVRPLVAGRVIVVLGCGGDRDRGKRPLMGAAAAAGADLSIFTSDNPRSEDPEVIIAQMCTGVRTLPVGARGGVMVEPDRAAAIRLAVSFARPEDAVVLAGKGHETGQEHGGTVTPFDDRDVLRVELAGRRPASWQSPA
ncbi:UDP-N-acetylmuramoyl-L-alanyl-D-glutamate-2, 6-diaminopimelate ligase [Candidatus Protofrankia californiensis]|uniref:UDP-N-acetylmuramoyl-L-alanyl-D-glutamate--2,6-diaminopimelate ligase n=1 Tax=Candidatus Protofrankia californiensis TaxID=1839754 RepID=A0A1C3P7P6_9ACTN|nr:UDP-N-acetylmuramoyl-L-alanyl-D-glutamate-2, 6-diaminopimelate ligase [Candidatus Protofrankia californiensis]